MSNELEPRLFGTWTTTLDGKFPAVFKFSENAEFELELTIPQFGKTAVIAGKWKMHHPTEVFVHDLKTSNLFLKMMMRKSSPIPFSDLTDKSVVIHFQGKQATLSKTT